MRTAGPKDGPSASVPVVSTRRRRTRRFLVLAIVLLSPLAICFASDGGDTGARLYEGDPALRAALSETAIAAIAEDHGVPSVTTGSVRFDGEWALVTLQMNVLGLGQVAHDDPARRDRHVEAMRRGIEHMLAPELRAFGTAAWGEDGLSDAALASHDGHAYLGYLALAMSMLRTLDPAMPDAALHDRLIDALERRIDAAPHGLIETYPGESYPADVSACIGAIGLRAHALRRPVPALVSRWEALVRAHDLDAHGYLVQSIDAQTGEAHDGGRGSGTAIASYFLSFAAPALSRDLERALASRRSRVLFVDGVLEHPDGSSGGDVDSGPVIFGVGVASTGFTLGAARAADDRETFVALYATAHRFGGVRDDGHARHFVTGLEIGNAILFAMLTARSADAW